MPRVVDVPARRAELALAAARVIARSGIAGASMREVAAEAGWTTGTLTHYFGDKRELLRFTLLSSLRQRGTHLTVDPDARPADLIYEALCAALPLDAEAELHWRVTLAFFTHAGNGDPELVKLQRNTYRTFRDRMTWLVIAAHGLDHAIAVREAERLIAAADGIAVQALFDPASWPPERQIEALEAAIER